MGTRDRGPGNRQKTVDTRVAERRKPNSVPRLRAFRRVGEATIIPLAPSLLTGSSSLPGSITRAACCALPYLALLRAGFCLPPMLPPARCALTAPFHPYSPSRPPGAPAQQAGPAALKRPKDAKAGGMFSVPLSFELPRPAVNRRTALRSSDFPLASAPSGRFGAASSRACRAEASEGRESGRSSGALRPSIIARARSAFGIRHSSLTKRRRHHPSDSWLIAYCSSFL